MTYRQLKEQLSKLSEEQLDCEVIIHNLEPDEYLSPCNNCFAFEKLSCEAYPVIEVAG